MHIIVYVCIYIYIYVYVYVYVYIHIYRERDMQPFLAQVELGAGEARGVPDVAARGPPPLGAAMEEKSAEERGNFS